MKISIIGLGHVGSTIAYTLMIKGLGKEILLWNRSINKAKGDALDLSQAASFTNQPMKIRAGELEETTNSDVILISVSAPWREHYTSRFDFTKPNLDIYKKLIPTLLQLSPQAKFIIISNPVDIMTYICIKHLGIPKQQVLGIGTLIDSGRFRESLSQLMHIHPDDIRAYVIGEHGNTQFAMMSHAFVGGQRIKDVVDIDSILEEDAQTGYRLMEWKGYSNFAISMAAALVVESIVKDTKRTMPISTMLENYYGWSDVCLSVPAVVGKNGIEQVILPILNLEEEAALNRSATVLKEVIEQYDL